TVKNFSSFTFVTPNATDQVTIDSPASPAGQSRFFGNSSGITFFATAVFNTPLMILYAAANDGGRGNDAHYRGSLGSNTRPTNTPSTAPPRPPARAASLAIPPASPSSPPPCSILL